MVRRYITPKLPAEAPGEQSELALSAVAGGVDGEGAALVIKVPKRRGRPPKLRVPVVQVGEGLVLEASGGDVQETTQSGVGGSGTRVVGRRRGGSRTPAPEVREKAVASRRQQSTFNKFLKSLSSRASRELGKVLEELNRGTRIKHVPSFAGGKRVGSVEKEVPLLPSDRALLLTRKKQLEGALSSSVPAALRREFIAMLPEYAKHNKYDRTILIEVGVPADVLDEAGIF